MTGPDNRTASRPDIYLILMVGMVYSIPKRTMMFLIFIWVAVNSGRL